MVNIASLKYVHMYTYLCIECNNNSYINPIFASYCAGGLGE